MNRFQSPPVCLRFVYKGTFIIRSELEIIFLDGQCPGRGRSGRGLSRSWENVKIFIGILTLKNDMLKNQIVCFSIEIPIYSVQKVIVSTNLRHMPRCLTDYFRSLTFSCFFQPIFNPTSFREYFHQNFRRASEYFQPPWRTNKKPNRPKMNFERSKKILKAPVSDCPSFYNLR